MEVPEFALSLKQPWAALLAAGVKTVEVRTWLTHRRGLVYIHASKIPDERAEGWSWLTTPELKAAAELRGGLIGIGDLIDCRKYTTAETFVADRGRHLNHPDWWVEKGLYGFAFRSLQFIPFRAYTGNTFFFPVPPISEE